MIDLKHLEWYDQARCRGMKTSISSLKLLLVYQPQVSMMRQSRCVRCVQLQINVWLTLWNAKQMTFVGTVCGVVRPLVSVSTASMVVRVAVS
jgi:hypothetical protein